MAVQVPGWGDFRLLCLTSCGPRSGFLGWALGGLHLFMYQGSRYDFMYQGSRYDMTSAICLIAAHQDHRTADVSVGQGFECFVDPVQTELLPDEGIERQAACQVHVQDLGDLH